MLHLAAGIYWCCLWTATDIATSEMLIDKPLKTYQLGIVWGGHYCCTPSQKDPKDMQQQKCEVHTIASEDMDDNVASLIQEGEEASLLKVLWKLTCWSLLTDQRRQQ